MEEGREGEHELPLNVLELCSHTHMNQESSSARCLLRFYFG